MRPWWIRLATEHAQSEPRAGPGAEPGGAGIYRAERKTVAVRSFCFVEAEGSKPRLPWTLWSLRWPRGVRARRSPVCSCCAGRTVVCDRTGAGVLGLLLCMWRALQNCFSPDFEPREAQLRNLCQRCFRSAWSHLSRCVPWPLGSGNVPWGLGSGPICLGPSVRLCP